MNKAFYIPWFWNQDDSIREKAHPEADIIQKNLRIVSPEATARYLETTELSKLKKKIKSKYPSTTDEDFNAMVWDIRKFQWFTRNINLTLSLTKKKIFDCLENKCSIDLAWHSQWWLLTMQIIISNTNLLHILKEIVIYAPVCSYWRWAWFHIWKEKWYLNRKWVLVRKDYIQSLNAKHNFSIILMLANTLRMNKFNWSFKVIYSSLDPVIDSRSISELAIKQAFPKTEFIDTKIDNHYLWYK